MSESSLLSKTKAGFRAIDRKDLPAAIAAFEEAVAKDPGDLQAWLGLGRVRMAIGRSDAARAAFDRVLSLQPQHSEAASQSALLRAQAGDEKAMDDLIALTKAKDAGFYAYFNLGKVLAARRDWPGARRAYEEAVKLEPKSPFPHVELAQVAMEQKDTTRAITHLEQAAALDPEDWEPVYMLARARILQGEVGQASLLLLKAIERSPHNELLRADLVKVCLAAANTKGALVAAEQLFGEFPDSPQTLYLYGVALLANGQAQDAKTALEEAIKKAATPEEAAQVQQTLDEVKRAIAPKKL